MRELTMLRIFPSKVRPKIDRKGAAKAAMIDQDKGHAGILLIMGHQHHPVWGRTTTGSPLRPPAPLYKPLRPPAPPLQAHPAGVNCVNCATAPPSNELQYNTMAPARTWVDTKMPQLCSDDNQW